MRLFNFTVLSNHLAIFNFAQFNEFFLDPVSYSTWNQQEKKIAKLLLNQNMTISVLSTLGVLTFN